MDTPHPNNFCGGNFQDWLEVNLTEVCNAKCAWCVEKKGWHPTEHVCWEVIAANALYTGKKNIILLGGEPALYPDLQSLIQKLAAAGRNVYITTNGSKLTPSWVKENLVGIHGVNISIHHHDVRKNKEITGIALNPLGLWESVDLFHSWGVKVRFNCNCIKGYIESEKDIRDYIAWVKVMKVNSVRFAELKGEDNSFVDLAKVFDHQYGLNDDPYSCGCNTNVVIDGMSVNFRQMCGMQTSLRPCPKNPVITDKQVLYYDGNIYNGWQQKEKDMTITDLVSLLEAVQSGEKKVSEAAVEIAQEMTLDPPRRTTRTERTTETQSVQGLRRGGSRRLATKEELSGGSCTY